MSLTEVTALILAIAGFCFCGYEARLLIAQRPCSRARRSRQ